MKNKDMIRLLEQLDPEDEICINITDLNLKKKIISTYSFNATNNDYNELMLNVEIEI